ncbi:MAG: hypothetical protein RI920_1411 [Pseudomonadota bacterium]|jgi:hypothetical protein
MLALLLPVPHRLTPSPQRPRRDGQGPRRGRSWLVAIVLSLLAGGCMLRPPQSGEETMVDSQMPGDLVGAGLVGKPFCLHLRYHNHFFPMYSDAQAEAWVSEGSCASKGPTRSVGTLRLSWWYDWEDTQSNRQCLQAERCSMDQQHVVLSRNIRCAATQAADGPHTAFITTDHAVCH